MLNLKSLKPAMNVQHVVKGRTRSADTDFSQLEQGTLFDLGSLDNKAVQSLRSSASGWNKAHPDDTISIRKTTAGTHTIIRGQAKA